MKTAAELRQEADVLLTQAEELLAKAEGEDRDFTADEDKQYADLMENRDGLLTRAKRMEETGRLRDESNESVRRAPTRQPITGGPDEPEKFSLGETIQAIALRNGNQDLSRVANFDKIERRAAGLNETIGSDGGFFVGTDMSTDLIKAVHDTGVLIDRCRRIPISAGSNSVKINGVNETSRVAGSRQGGITATWLNEGGTKSDSTPEYRQIEIKLNKLTGLCYLTDELLQDAAALEAVVKADFANEFGFMVDDAIFQGTGAGMPLGILNSPALVTVAKETGQANTTIVAENIEKMYSRMWAKSLPNSAWPINQDCWPQLFQLRHAVGTGGVPVFMPPNGLSGSPFGDLMGRPILPIEQAATLGTKGDIMFVDFTQYLLAEKGGIDTASSIHVRFVYDETTLRFVLRIGGLPSWNSALTPYKGTNTQSPFVALAARP